MDIHELWLEDSQIPWDSSILNDPVVYTEGFKSPFPRRRLYLALTKEVFTQVSPATYIW